MSSLEFTGADARAAAASQTNPEALAMLEETLAAAGVSWETIAFRARKIAADGVEAVGDTSLVPADMWAIAGYVSGYLMGVGDGIGAALEMGS